MWGPVCEVYSPDVEQCDANKEDNTNCVNQNVPLKEISKNK